MAASLRLKANNSQQTSPKPSVWFRVTAMGFRLSSKTFRPSKCLIISTKSSSLYSLTRKYLGWITRPWKTKYWHLLSFTWAMSRCQKVVKWSSQLRSWSRNTVCLKPSSSILQYRQDLTFLASCSITIRSKLSFSYARTLISRWLSRASRNSHRPQ